MTHSPSGQPIALPRFPDLIHCIVCHKKKAPRVLDAICDDCILEGMGIKDND